VNNRREDSIEELRQDLRAVLKKCRPDWDIPRPELKAAWERVNMIAFIPMARPTGKCFGSKSKRRQGSSYPFSGRFWPTGLSPVAHRWLLHSTAESIFWVHSYSAISIANRLHRFVGLCIGILGSPLARVCGSMKLA
jgi:hypothetical protein